MPATDTSLFSWEQEAYNNFGNKTQLLKCNIDILDDESLIDLLVSGR